MARRGTKRSEPQHRSEEDYLIPSSGVAAVANQ
jgi:hypothetical protein